MKMDGGNTALKYSQGKIDLPNQIDPKIKKELLEAEFDLSISVKKEDESIVASFDYCRNNAGKNGESDYRHFTKTFTTWKDFGEMADSFFEIQEIKDNK
jgi:hypothetical protein